MVAGRAYEFANDLVQEVLYETTPAPTRLAYHARAADLLVDNPEAVARHAEAAGDDRRAARAWLSAGQRAARRYASADADALFGRASAAATRVGDLELLGRGHLGRGRVREPMFRFAEALDGLRRRRCGSAARSATAGWRWPRCTSSAARRGPASAARWPTASPTSARRCGSPSSSATAAPRRACSSWLAILSSNRLRFDEALRYGRRAYDAAVVAGDDASLAAALDGLQDRARLPG